MGSTKAEASESPPGATAGPLEGIRVLELGQLIAGPFAGSVLAYFGAEVIKVEPPGAGDPIRRWRQLRNGTSLWWRSMARNKKSVTIDLRQDERSGSWVVTALKTKSGSARKKPEAKKKPAAKKKRG